MYQEPSNIYTLEDLKKMISSERTINGSVTIRGEHLESLDGVEKIIGDIGLSDSGIKSLGVLKEITGNLWISIHNVYSPLETLGHLERVGGDLSLRYSNVADLGALKWVGGKLSLRDTKIDALGHLEYVGGDLYLPKRLEGKLDLSGVTVKGKVKYWNDSKEKKEITPKSELGLIQPEVPVPYWEHTYVFSSAELQAATPEQRSFYDYFKNSFLKGRFLDTKGNSNYEFILMFDLLDEYRARGGFDRLQKQFEELGRHYQKAGRYAMSILSEVLEESSKYEKAWEMKRAKGDALRLMEIYEYELKLGRRLVDGSLMAKHAGYSHLTYFGQNNIDQIIPLAEQHLDEFERERGVRFFEAFFKTSDASKKRGYSFSVFKDEYYRQFYLSEEEYDFYKEIDDSQRERNYSRGVTHVAEKAILSQFRLFLKKAEDLYRESIGMPRVGEGWISETELFYKIAKAFPQYEVIHHGRPKWLGNQHLDIYIPELNVGVEYQGAQHYVAIEYFGGEEALEKTIERDRKKRIKCEENGCTLIYVDEGYIFEDVKLEIEKTIR